MTPSTVLHLCVAHEYCVSPDRLVFDVRPRASTRRLLAGRRLEATEAPSSLRLWKTQAQRAPRTATLPRLEFVVCSDDPHHHLYTEFDALRADRLAHYRLGATQTLQASETVARLADDPPTAVAIVTFAPKLLRARKATVVQLLLPARRAYWRYYCVLPVGEDARALSWMPAGATRAAGDVGFSMESATGSDESTALDPIASKLHERYPQQVIVTLTSATPIAARSRAQVGIGLVLNEQTVVRRLPSPPLKNRALKDPSPSSGETAEMIFKTIHISTQTTLSGA